MFKKILAALITAALLLSASSALAASVSLIGTVVNTQEETVSAAYGGVIENVYVKPGEAVRAGDVLATIKTQKVYALQDGVARVFGSPGESAEMIANEYGAVVYVEPMTQYTVQASTKTADANNESNQFIHPGETVYLRAVENMYHTGVGLVTSVSGGSFTVVLTRGNFSSGDSANVYRDPAYNATTRLDKGSVSLVDPVAYTAEGVVVAYAVENGAVVKKGDVLFETVEGAYAGPSSGWTAISAPCDGIVASLAVSKGASIAAGSAAATLYASEGIRIEAAVSETDLHLFRAGDRVNAEFSYLNDGLLSVKGVIESVSPLGDAVSGDAESEEAWYTVRILPESTQGLYYGAHAVVTLIPSQPSQEE